MSPVAVVGPSQPAGDMDHDDSFRDNQRGWCTMGGWPEAGSRSELSHGRNMIERTMIELKRREAFD